MPYKDPEHKKQWKLENADKVRAHAKSYRERHKPDPVEKSCVACGSAFFGRSNKCDDCIKRIRSEKNTASQKSRRERGLVQPRNYKAAYWANPEKSREKNRAKRAANPEKYAEFDRLYREANKEKIAAYSKEKADHRKELKVVRLRKKKQLQTHALLMTMEPDK